MKILFFLVQMFTWRKKRSCEINYGDSNDEREGR